MTFACWLRMPLPPAAVWQYAGRAIDRGDCTGSSQADVCLRSDFRGNLHAAGVGASGWARTCTNTFPWIDNPMALVVDLGATYDVRSLRAFHDGGGYYGFLPLDAYYTADASGDDAWSVPPNTRLASPASVPPSCGL